MGEMNESTVIDHEVNAAFISFVDEMRPRLLQALVARLGPDRGADGLSHALAFAWERWDKVAPMENRVGYLYRVGISRGRGRITRSLNLFPAPPENREPWIEPELPRAMSRLSARQRTAVVLVHCFGWTIAEAAEVVGVAKSTLQTHLERGMGKLRDALEVEDVE